VKKNLRISLLVVAVALLISATVLAVGAWDHYGLPTHPHFWPVMTMEGEWTYVAKQFLPGRGAGTPITPMRTLVWVQSYPSLSGDGYRYVRYLSPNGTGGWDQWEFEHHHYIWNDLTSATFSEFGGNRVYEDYVRCGVDDNNDDNRGIHLPNIPSGVQAAYEPASIKLSDGTCAWNYEPYWHPDGSFVLFVRAWDGSGTSRDWNHGWHLAKDWFCWQYFKEEDYNVEDPTPTDVAYNICLDAPHVEVVYQVYWREAVDEEHPAALGCEAVVYASGYQQPPPSLPLWSVGSRSLKEWFRNGELRFSAYMGLGLEEIGNPPPPESAYAQYWIDVCDPAFSQGHDPEHPPVDNYFYTGIYQLDDDDGTTRRYQDTGQDELPILLP
jgi:hypothetical protein